MKYPDWAPNILVKYLEDRRSIDAESVSDTGVNSLARFKNMRIKVCFNKRYLPLFLLPDDRSVIRLEKLLTDPRMKNVWGALRRRVCDDEEFVSFVLTCNRALDEWRGDLKLKASERKAIAQEIQDTVTKLDALITKTPCFDYYDIHHLFSDVEIRTARKDLESSENVSSGGLVIGARFPTISDILKDISRRAKQYGEEEHPVKKPNSENADIHYFVRKLYQYLQEKYNRPLYEVVAATTEVVFDRQNISSDYVRELVRRYPVAFCS
ncbi:hypothetical protein SAMN05216412_11018 [Nitrosospira multiformis]|uniref:Uncharacterized protein n=1 Tax=Nitrosospira multiformis TaxID=1231 RepID=A0A1I0FT98_9PROT|nr:hypothetical protein [Nitrosospira multiformis]SET60872.1 hypothetical protein SAMN05216412_11018 [Nitrosospira multiformis]